jgi:hypothetical protein
MIYFAPFEILFPSRLPPHLLHSHAGSVWTLTSNPLYQQVVGILVVELVG